MGKTVLIVEDDFLIAIDLQITVERGGWRVIGPAATVEEALRLLAGEQPDVALLDVNLGRQLVTPVAEALAASNVPFALASAYDDPAAIAGAVLAGVPNLGKPVTEARLLTTLAALLAGR